MTTSKTTTGATTDALTRAVSWVCLPYLKKSLMITNTDPTNALRYLVSGFVRAGSKTGAPIWPECVLKAGDSQPLHIEYCWELVTVEVISEVPGAHASYIIEYCGAG